MKSMPSTFKLCFALLLALAMASAAHAAGMVSIKGNWVNLRAGPDQNSKVVWQLSRHYPLQVIKRLDGWLKVRDFEGDVGWVAAELTSKSSYMIVKASRVSLRSGPGTRYKRIARADYADLLKSIEQRPGWVKVEIPGGKGQGWVARSLVWGW